ncbi:LOW QUALITY PROTEIN: hypothetical protein SORBI_3003G001901 [Sorghum bicolor]|uniref:DUF1618 domain-containing protein n=1 Tax=Sorghum bicolor TaxID=4558 RepID=A0A1B6Q0J5_SORBI|nr:LOW QUALITY PROTEIN: hypothetical protein SORBI_3003G001901 [Sorghum bicolor]
MAPPPSWIILSTTPRVSDTPLPPARLRPLPQPPPRVSFLTLAPSVSFLLADFHFTVGSGGEEDTLVRYWSRTRNWRTEYEASPDQTSTMRCPRDRYWVFDDVVSHHGKICFVPLPDVDVDFDQDRRFSSDLESKFERGIIGRRYVQLSDAKFRCVQIRKPRGHAHGASAAPTFITMRTLDDRETGDWTDPEYKLSFADIRASDTFKAAGLPDKDPVFALIHPKNPDVLYFFLDGYLFSFDMRAKKLIECEAHGLGNNPSSASVRAWELPPDYAAAIAPAPAAFRHYRRLDQQEELELGTVVSFLAGLARKAII